MDPVTSVRARAPVAAGIGWLAFLILAVLVTVRWQPLIHLDGRVALDLNRDVAPHSGEVTFWKVVTTALQPAVFEVLAVITALVLYVRQRTVAPPVVLLVAIFGTVGWYDLVKVIVDRPRPVVPVPLLSPSGSSFPSGHAMMSVVALTSAVILLARVVQSRPARVGVVAVAVALALAVSFSRLALGAHYPSDVLGGWLLAVAWLCTLAWAVPRVSARVTRPTRHRRSDR